MNMVFLSANDGASDDKSLNVQVGKDRIESEFHIHVHVHSREVIKGLKALEAWASEGIIKWENLSRDSNVESALLIKMLKKKNK